MNENHTNNVSGVGPELITLSSGEPAAMSNSHVLRVGAKALLFDVVQQRHEALLVAEELRRRGLELETIWISHAHPDHYLGLDVLADAYPRARILALPAVVSAIAATGPVMVKALGARWGDNGPRRLVVPEAWTESRLRLADCELEVLRFSGGESASLGTLRVADTGDLLCADLVYDQTHLFLRERNLEGWLEQLAAFERGEGRRVRRLFPGHGLSGGLELVAETRRYLETFRQGLALGGAAALKEHMLRAFPGHAVRRLLTDYSIPAYFP